MSVDPMRIEQRLQYQLRPTDTLLPQHVWTMLPKGLGPTGKGGKTSLLCQGYGKLTRALSSLQIPSSALRDQHIHGWVNLCSHSLKYKRVCLAGSSSYISKRAHRK